MAYDRNNGSVQSEQPNLISRNEVAVVHIRIAVDVSAIEHRVPHTAGFVLNPGQRLVRVHIDDIEEAILMLIALFRDQTALNQLLMRPGKVRERDLDVMTVIFRQFGLGLTVDHLAFAGARSPGVSTPIVLGYTANATK